jgi:undecaprenyl phosphate-alpha-L-ara4FN deformylase
MTNGIMGQGPGAGEETSENRTPGVEGSPRTPDPGPRTPLLGLRVDVDTHEGMKSGVPRLLDVLAAHGVKGTFYLSMGPDNSGRAIFNVLRRPGFLTKMHRTRAARIYGLRTILSGTLLPARMIALALADTARRIPAEGHEVGVHAWDHRRWQDRLDSFSEAQVARELARAYEAFTEIFGVPPQTFAAPAWLGSDASLSFQENLGLEYASDCRGDEPFLPIVGGATLATPQVPTTLPTLDEALGDTHADASSFFISALEASGHAHWPVLTVHAELEGGGYAGEFDRFLDQAGAEGLRVVPLTKLLEARQATGAPLPLCAMRYGTVRGRHGRVFMPVAG